MLQKFLPGLIIVLQFMIFQKFLIILNFYLEVVGMGSVVKFFISYAIIFLVLLLF
ncbi:hypothetical protein C2G38_2066764 [Gigaspora rosea]|uniref:Uncharacterized protein n=1 Tax=Gigaspora rosea TaxID=44941 RepID=A0A397VWN4_9GLOM|nr:hypothetical protein C2G38_2066764 [Gigaspora rosea]